MLTLLGRSVARRWSSRRCSATAAAPAADDDDDDLFAPHPAIPGFYFSDDLLPAADYKQLLALFSRLGRGKPEPFGSGVYAGLEFPSEPADFKAQLEARLGPLVERIRFFAGQPAVGVVLLRYEAAGALPPHRDDPDRYGDAVCTIGFGSPAVLQMQRDSDDGKKQIQRVLLDAGSAYVMTGDARHRWLHGIEPGDRIDLGDGEYLKRTTRYALLLTPPRYKFSGTVLLRHPSLPAACTLLPSHQGGIITDHDSIISFQDYLQSL